MQKEKFQEEQEQFESYKNIEIERIKHSQEILDSDKNQFEKYKEEISFVPMYTAPDLKTVYLGKPVRFDSSAPISEERTRICSAMMDSITEIARSLPEHTVVPYPNIPKRDYPSNKAITKEFNSNGLSDTQA